MSSWEQMLAEVVRTRRAALVGYASLFALNRIDGEDLVQEALVRTFARRRAFPDSQAAEGYVRAAIRTSFLDRARRVRSGDDRAHLFLLEDARGPDSSVPAVIDVRAALAVLAPRERACAVLRFFDDLSVAEIAGELNLSEGAVKRYLSDATTKLRAELGEQVGFHGTDVQMTRVSVSGEGRAS